MSYGSKRAGRTVEATNSGSQRDTNSNAGRRRERWARLFACVRSRLVMNRPLILGLAAAALQHHDRARDFARAMRDARRRSWTRRRARTSSSDSRTSTRSRICAGGFTSRCATCARRSRTRSLARATATTFTSFTVQGSATRSYRDITSTAAADNFRHFLEGEEGDQGGESEPHFHALRRSSPYLFHASFSVRVADCSSTYPDLTKTLLPSHTIGSFPAPCPNCGRMCKPKN